MSAFERKLIALVRSNPLLYKSDLRCTPYESKKKRYDIWCSIATSLETDPKSCMLRWKCLREKLHRELTKEMSDNSGGSDWSLLEQMRFVVHNTKKYSERQLRIETQNKSMPLDDMNAELLIEEVFDDEDDPLQEAMDEQNTEGLQEIINVESHYNHLPHNSLPLVSTVPIATNTGTPIAILSTPLLTGANLTRSNELKRIEALLDGLNPINRERASRRILAYLCKCNLLALNNNSIEHLEL